jgi:hypothetical protein
LVSHVKRRTQIEGVYEQGAEETFGPKRDELIGGWRRLYNEELHNLYSSQIIGIILLRRIRKRRQVLRMRMGNAQKIWVGIPEGR